MLPVNRVTSVESGTGPIGRRRRLRYWFTIVRNKITTFNLFPDRVDDDENRIREQRYASRMKIYEDFRVQATGQFQLLQSFCELAEQTVVRALQDFATSEFITANVISATIFDAQMRSTINTFQLETPSAFISTLELIRRTTHGNAFMTVYASNWE
ncbi:unnamed protein product [Rotaria sordida]|uniref:Uncharacterized protein n=1 Tax=Rotaria sordida TaxID=392033 RepID=A0A814ZKE9_9BILA|nr:unnamed protein product [Rotaria sordida]